MNYKEFQLKVIKKESVFLRGEFDFHTNLVKWVALKLAYMFYHIGISANFLDIFSLFGNILSIFTVAIFALYLLLIRDRLDSSLDFLLGKEKAKNASNIINTLEIKLGSWARGQFSLMLLIGLLSYIGFIILGIPYALPLAMLAGIFEIVPYIGPIIASIPAIILGFSISPFLGFAAIGLAVLIQQLENYVFVPKITEKSTGVSPIITLLSLAIGFRLLGIVGMIISIPLVIIIQTLAFRPLESDKQSLATSS